MLVEWQLAWCLRRGAAELKARSPTLYRSGGIGLKLFILRVHVYQTGVRSGAQLRGGPETWAWTWIHVCSPSHDTRVWCVVCLTLGRSASPEVNGAKVRGSLTLNTTGTATGHQAASVSRPSHVLMVNKASCESQVAGITPVGESDRRTAISGHRPQQQQPPTLDSSRLLYHTTSSVP